MSCLSLINLHKQAKIEAFGLGTEQFSLGVLQLLKALQKQQTNTRQAYIIEAVLDNVMSCLSLINLHEQAKLRRWDWGPNNLFLLTDLQLLKSAKDANK